MGRSKQDNRTPSAIARTMSTHIVATQGLEAAFWIANAMREQVVSMVVRQIEAHPEDWPGNIRKALQSEQPARVAEEIAEIPPPPPL